MFSFTLPKNIPCPPPEIKQKKKEKKKERKEMDILVTVHARRVEGDKGPS